MITVSDHAKAVLWQSLQQAGIPTDRGLRLQRRVDGFAFELDQPTKDDRVIHHRDVPILIIDGGLDEEIDDLLIDVTNGPQGTQLTIHPLPDLPADS
ncbi:MAG: hypothetical protein ACE5Q6_21555 [Dehalococcoidia bacterium]